MAIETKTTTVVSGKVATNSYGNWDDVDKGLFVGGDKIETVLWDYKGKNVKITIEEMEVK